MRQDTLRIKAAEVNRFGNPLATIQRYFSFEQFYTAQVSRNEVREEVMQRYAELLAIWVFELGGQSFTLLKGSWFKSGSSFIDTDTQTPRLKKTDARDTSREDLIDANEVNNQVVIVDCPYQELVDNVWLDTQIIFDRKFDTLSFGGIL